MADKKVSIDGEIIRKIAEREGTPFNIYDGDAILSFAKRFYKAFSWADGFTNYFAVKALPNINILRLLKSAGMGGDCSSLPELMLCETAGITGNRIMFSSNDTPLEEFRKAFELGAIINLDDIKHIESVLKACPSFPESISFRYNPGKDRTGNAIIGNPVEAKYGVTKDQVVECYRIAKEKGAKHFFIHAMVASNCLKEDDIVETARMLFDLVAMIRTETGVAIEGVDFGGGIGIPYKPSDKEMDIEAIGSRIRELYDGIIVSKGFGPLKIAFECGRCVTGPYGYLVSKVRHVTHKYKDYVGLDACMADLMRPGLYGAYHHITVLGKESKPSDFKYDVTGSLCENNDK
ncbi:MAG TPA: diaminopimelate decarboxylase, partial [Spirochaetaceae bacterium]|nr:diaminopimelate decarboxylase [Spirochaetaceae bacterium]